METIGSCLKEERERLCMSQTQFGDKGDVKKGAQINYENGTRSPDLEYLAAIAALGVDIYYIITGKRVFPDEPVFKEQRERDLLMNFRESAEPEKEALMRLSFASRYMHADREKKKSEENYVKP